MEARGSGYAMCGRNAILLSVASYENKEISGAAVCPALHRRCVFSNLTQLLLKMEDMLNELNTPQRAMELRTFGSWREQPSPQEERESAGPVLATMKVTVLFRQNASWQGTVEWTEQHGGSLPQRAGADYADGQCADRRPGFCAAPVKENENFFRCNQSETFRV